MAGREIDADTLIYRVGVGTSRQADRDYLFLLAQAVEHNWYFEKWSTQVAEFLHNVLVSLAPASSDDPLGGTLVHGVLLRDLVRAIKNGESVPVDDNAIRNANHMRQWLSLNYRTMLNRQGEDRPLPSE